MRKQLMIVGIILLFFGISFQSVSAEKSVITLVDNNKIEPLDEQKEVMTVFSWVCAMDVKAGGGWGHFDTLIIGGHIELWGKEMNIWGYKLPLFPLSKFKFNIKVSHIYAPFFFGSITGAGPAEIYVIGRAFGNIEWS